MYCATVYTATAILLPVILIIMLAILSDVGTTNEKVNYAKRMAQGYLKSVGMGDYTPQTSGYSKVKISEQSLNSVKGSPNKPSSSLWRKQDDQDKEFDFDIWAASQTFIISDHF